MDPLPHTQEEAQESWRMWGVGSWPSRPCLESWWGITLLLLFQSPSFIPSSLAPSHLTQENLVSLTRKGLGGPGEIRTQTPN